MNTADRPSLTPRWLGLSAAILGMALVLTALVLWSGADSWRGWLAWAGAGALIALGNWLERLSEALRDFGRIVLGGGLATLYAVTFAAHHHGSFFLLRGWFLALLALAFIGEVITRCAARRNSTKLAAVAFALAGFGAALQPFASSYLGSAVVLAAAAGWFVVRSGGNIVAWLTLAIAYAGFLVWWPFDDGRLDADRYLELHEYFETLCAFGLVWLLFARTSSLARFEPSHRLAFSTLNNLLFFGLGVLIVPPAHPDWHWKSTLIFGVVLLVAGVLTRPADIRRSYFVQGGLLAVLGIVSALTGRELAALLAVASAFCVLTVTRREDWLRRDLAFAAALLTVAAVWMPLREHAENGLRLGALTGGVLLFNACSISSRRDLWARWAVAVFTALGLGVWMATTLHFTPETQRAPVLAFEGVLLTASFATLAVFEIPWLAKAFSLGALVVWFLQLEAFVRPWWHPVVLVLATIAVSAWWQTRGRSLLPAWELGLVQAIAAAASVLIALLWIDGRLASQPAALLAMSVLALVALLFSIALRDLFLTAFSQLFTITAIGEFIGQHTTAPLPGALAALAPIVALPILARLIPQPFKNTEWEKPIRWVAALYGIIAAALFVVWVLHYLSPPNRIPALALAAIFLLIWSVVVQPAGPLLASLVCASGALLALWLGWIGSEGFLLRHLFSLILLLGFGVIGRRTCLLPVMLQKIGTLIGLASVVHWVTLWAPVHFAAVPLAVVWSVVAVIIFALGWWLDEPLYRALAWTLLATALARVLWLESHATAPFRLGLLAIGAATLLAAASYARRSAPAT